MALDGLITKVEPHEEGIRISLGPRPAKDYIAEGGEVAYEPASEPGQPSLIIVSPTVTPKVGDQVWGGSGFAHIVMDGNTFPYRREGYIRLKQDWSSK